MLRLSDENTYSDQLYARGYILRSDRAPEAPAQWARDSFGGFHLAHDPRLEATRVQAGGCDLLALGIIVDPRHPEEGRTNCLTRLAGALAQSEEALHAALDYTAGRYVLIYSDASGRTAIVSDATGMKPVFYYTGTPRMVVSHPHLIYENTPGAQPRNPLATKFGYPGLRAPVSDSFLLTPNARLDLGTMKPMRVWPREPVPRRDVPAAAEIVRANMDGLMRHARAHHRLIVSTTAGLDSRLTLSFLKDAPEVPFFTYYRSDKTDTDPADLSFAEALRDEFGREVEILRLSQSRPAPDAFKALTRANTFIEHQRRLAWVYFDRYGGEDNLVHMRSNISEIGREFWGGKPSPMRSGTDLARIYLRLNQEYRAQYVFRVIDLFEEFDRVTGLTKCRELVDVKSLFYWEFRMASWHAQLVCESDPAFDTLSLFNCRATLEAMLSVPREDRVRGSVLRHVIAANWPELTEYPVNGKPFWPAAVDA